MATIPFSDPDRQDSLFAEKTERTKGGQHRFRGHPQVACRRNRFRRLVQLGDGLIFEKIFEI
jgi:hypothetical protein